MVVGLSIRIDGIRYRVRKKRMFGRSCKRCNVRRRETYTLGLGERLMNENREQSITEVYSVEHHDIDSVSSLEEDGLNNRMNKEILIIKGFEILNLIGKGGMGAVFQVRDLNLARVVAMKIMHKKYRNSTNAKTRFLREAKICAYLQHPNIVPVYSMGELSDGRHYFTMKEIQGRELSSYIFQFWNDGFTIKKLQELLQYFAQVCDAIGYAHNKGVIHRDIKPSNIMLGAYGEVYIVDWGLAKTSKIPQRLQKREVTLENIITREGQIAGTPLYMSPEQALGKTSQISKQSDIYSLGCVLYTIITGKPPFYEQSKAEVLESVRYRKPRRITSILRERSIDTDFITASLIQIANTAMNKESMKRYAKAEDMSRNIRDWLNNSRNRERGLALYWEGKEIQRRIIEEHRGLARLVQKIVQFWVREGLSEQMIDVWKRKEEQKRFIRTLDQEQEKKYKQALLFSENMPEVHNEIIRMEFERNGARGLLDLNNPNADINSKLKVHRSKLSPEAKDYWDMLCFDSSRMGIGHLSRTRGSFVGRKKEKDKLKRMIQNNSCYTIVNGFAGVGKTSLVLNTLFEIKLNNPEQQVEFYDCRHVSSLVDFEQVVAEKICAVILKKDDVQRAGNNSDENNELYFIIDGLSSHIPILREKLIQWHTEYSKIHFIITTRLFVPKSADQTLTLTSMNINEAIDCFRDAAQKISPSFEVHPSNLAQVVFIVNSLDRLPLAMELAASRLSSLSLDELMSHLHVRLPLLKSPMRSKENRGLQTALDHSWNILQPRTRSILVQCCIFTGGFTLNAASEILIFEDQPTLPTIVDILDALVMDNLLHKELDASGHYRFSMLDIISEYAQEKMAHQLELFQRLKIRHCDYYASLGRDAVLYEESDVVFTDLILNLPNWKRAGQSNIDENGFDCCMTVVYILIRQGRAPAALEYISQLETRKDLSELQTIQIQVQKSICLEIQGNIESAKKILKEQTSLLLRDHHQEKILIAKCYVGLSEIAYKSSYVDECIKHLSKARTIYEDLKSVFGLNKVASNMSRAYFIKGQYDKSKHYEQEAHKYMAHCSNTTSKYHFMNLSATSNLANGKFLRAKKLYESALKEASRLGDKINQGKILGNISTMYVNIGDYKNALVYFEKAFSKQEEVGDQHAIALTIGMAGRIYYHLKQYKKSVAMFTQSIKISEGNKFHSLEAIFRGNLGITYARMNLIDAAKKELMYAIKKTSVMHPPACGAFQAELALILVLEGHVEKSEDLIHSAQLLTKSIASEYAKVLGKSSIVYMKMKKFDEARKLLKQSDDLSKKLNVGPNSEIIELVNQVRADLDSHVSP